MPLVDQDAADGGIGQAVATGIGQPDGRAIREIDARRSLNLDKKHFHRIPEPDDWPPWRRARAVLDGRPVRITQPLAVTAAPSG